MTSILEFPLSRWRCKFSLVRARCLINEIELFEVERRRMARVKKELKLGSGLENGWEGERMLAIKGREVRRDN